MDMAGGYRPDNVTPDMARVSTAAHERRPDEDAPSAGAADGGLRVQLDAPLPDELAVGAGTAVFVLGWCFSPDARIRSLDLVVDGVAEPVLAHGMPRLDVFGAMHPGIDPFAAGPPDSDSADDPLSNSYRSGFWGIARVPRAPDRGVIELELLRAGSRTGVRRSRRLASIPTAAKPDAVAAPDARILVRAAGRDLHGDVRPADGPVRAPAGLDPRRRPIGTGSASSATTARPPSASRRCGTRSKTTRASSSPAHRDASASTATSSARSPWSRPATAYVAMADQDDVWHPDKLEVLLDAIGDAQLVYSDARIVGRERRAHLRDLLGQPSQQPLEPALAAGGQLRSPARRRCSAASCSMTRSRSRRRSSRTTTTTGSRSPRSRSARSRSSSAPLYDYVQHGEAALGHAAANRIAALRRRFGSLRRDPRERGAGVADALLRRRLPPAAVRDRPEDALRRADGARQAPDARPVPADRPLAARARRGCGSRGVARARRPPGDARRRVDALLRLRLAPRARGDGPRPAARAPAAGRAPATEPRPQARPPPARPRPVRARSPRRSRRSSSRCATTPRRGSTS